MVADTVVLAAGSRSFDPLQTAVRARQIPYRVVGDAASVATAFEAVHQGYAAGRAI